MNAVLTGELQLGGKRLRSQERGAILFTALCLCPSEENIKAVGVLDLVSVPGDVKYPTCLLQ